MVGHLPLPEEHFGFVPGSDRQLVTWAAAVEYYRRVADRSDRVRFDLLGESTEGNPFIALTISAPANLARLDRLRAIQQRLADPRGLGDAEAERLCEEGCAVVVIGCSVHPAEVGAAQMAPLLVHELAARADAEAREILDNVVLILLPSANPDGMNLVTDWHERTKGTPAEGTWPPQISHKYVGGENNRDWALHTQVENQLVVDHVFNAWLPHVELDMHQQEPDGPRLVVPPYIDPVDPDVDPALTALANEVGAAIMSDLTAAGLRGVASRTIYQTYSPHSNYLQYHGGMRILSECASCELATPIEVAPGAFRVMGAIDPVVRGIDNPAPWPGGRWGLDDILAYDKAAALSVLGFAARRRRALLRNVLGVHRRALTPGRPHAFVIPSDQADARRVAELIEVLLRGRVEVHRAKTAFAANRTIYPAGSHVVLMAQPFGGYARTLLERREYPAVRAYPGGPAKPPYDVATHCLPLCFGVRADAVAAPFEAVLEPVTSPPFPKGHAAGAGDVFLLAGDANAAFLAASHALSERIAVSRATAQFAAVDRDWPAGTFLLRGIGRDAAERLAASCGVALVGGVPRVETRALTMPRVALYKPHMTGFTVCDEGWTRFVLERFGFPLTTIHNADVRAGGLAARFDVVILASQLPKDLLHGQDPREFPGVAPSNRDLPAVEEDLTHLRLSYPEPYAGGLGELGARQLCAFVESGGTLIALEASCDVVLDHCGLPVANVLRGIGREDFSCPGSLLRMTVDPDHPIGWGVEREVAAMCVHSPAFAAEAPAGIVARHVAGNNVAAGWIRGGERLGGRAALVDAPLGRGRAVLFGFRPQFRAQLRGTYRLFFNAILSAGLDANPTGGAT